MFAPLPEIVRCPHCWAENAAIDEHCHACSKPLVLYIGPRKPIRKVGLGSLMILIAAIAVCLGVVRASLGLGTFLLIVAVPALVRTAIAVRRRTVDDRPTSLTQVIGLFAVSIGIMMLVTLASSITFLALCIPIGAFSMGRGAATALALVIAGGAAIAVAGFLLKWTWPNKD